MKKEWDFGFGNLKVTIENEFLSWKFAMDKGSWPIKDITSITYETSGLSAKFSVYLGGTLAKTINIPRGSKSETNVKEIDSFLKENRPKEGTSSNLDDLKKLSELKDSGIITEEEFQAKKKQILGL